MFPSLQERIVPSLECEAHSTLNEWLRVGSREHFCDGRKTVVIRGFGEKFVSRGGLDHEHAGTYIDYTRLELVNEDTGEREWYTWTKDDCGNAGSLATFLKVSQLHIKVGPLPKTPFWEGDTVKIRDFTDYGRKDGINNRWVISGIDYNYLSGGTIRCDAHNIRGSGTLDKHHSANLSVNAFSLITRGNLWKMEHGEPMDFPGGIEEEWLFYQSLGMSQKICGLRGRPGDVGLFATEKTDEWEFPNAIRAVVAGHAHQLKTADKKLMTYVIIKYDVPKVPDFGERMRAHTLAKFGLTEEISA